MLKAMTSAGGTIALEAEAILRDAPVALLAYDATSGACLLASGAVERLVGQASAEIVRASLGDAAWWKPPAVIGAMRAALMHGDDLTHLQETVSPSGAVVVFEYRLRPVLHDGRVLLVARLEDITHRGADRDWRRTAERMEAIGRVAGDIAHEFGNLLTVILSFATLAHQELPEGDPTRSDLAEILSAAEAATSLATEFTALRRSRSRGREAVDIGALVAGLSVFLARLGAPQARIETDVADVALVAVADRADVEHALVNAVLQAKDLVAEGATLTLAVRRRGDAFASADDVVIELILPPSPPAAPLADPLEFVHAGPAYAAQHGSGYSLAERVARECGGNFRVRRAGSGAHVVELAFPALASAAEANRWNAVGETVTVE